MSEAESPSFETGIPLITISAIAGHSKPSITSDIYAYVLKGSDRQAAQIMGSFMTSGSQNQNDNLVDDFRKAKEEMNID